MRGWLLIAVAALAGCQSGRGHVAADRLTGTYAAVHAGVVEPVLRVSEAKGGGYRFEERITGEWRADGQVPHVATEDEVKRSLGVVKPGFRVFGLATDSVWLLKVPAEWSGVGVTTKSGFLLVSEGKVAAAEKVEMGGR